MRSTLSIAGLMALVSYAQADFAVGHSVTQMGIGEIVPNTGGDIYDTTNVDVSYPGGCLDNIQQFECLADRCDTKGTWEIKGLRSENVYKFHWVGDGWEFSEGDQLLGFCEENDDEGCSNTGVNYSIGFFSNMLCTGSIETGFDD